MLQYHVGSSVQTHKSLNLSQCLVPPSRCTRRRRAPGSSPLPSRPCAPGAPSHCCTPLRRQDFIFAQRRANRCKTSKPNTKGKKHRMELFLEAQWMHILHFCVWQKRYKTEGYFDVLHLIRLKLRGAWVAPGTVVFDFFQIGWSSWRQLRRCMLRSGEDPVAFAPHSSCGLQLLRMQSWFLTDPK